MNEKKSTNFKRKAIIVSGMHRSGTSAITRLFGILGYELPRNLIPTGPQNEKGYWESMDLYSIHEEILSRAGTSWDDVLRFPEAWFASEEAKDFQQRILTVLRREFGAARLLVIKDPRISRLVPLWLGVLRQFESAPSFVLTLRHPLEVAASLKVRDGFSKAKSLLLWLRHLVEAEKATRGQRRSFVSYDALLANWRKEIDRIGRDLGISWPELKPDRCAEIDTFLSIPLRHHAYSEKELDSYPEIGQWVKRIYRAAMQASRDSTAKLQREFDAVRHELENSDVTYGPIVANLRADAASQLSERDGQIASLTQAVAERDGQIASLTQAVAERDGQIASLSQAVAERDGQIASLSQAVAERDERLDALKSKTQDQREEINRLASTVEELEAALEQRDERIESLTSDHAKLRNQVQDLLNSTSWRVTAPLRGIKRLWSDMSRTPKKFSSTIMTIARKVYRRLPFKIQS